MICEEALLLMSAKLDGALTPDEEAALAEHLAACPACAELMETMRSLDTQLATLREPAPEGLKKGVIYRIDQATGKTKPARRGWFGPGTALSAVAAVLVLLVGLHVIPFPFSDSAKSESARSENAVFYTGAAQAETISPQANGSLSQNPNEAIKPESEASRSDSALVETQCAETGNDLESPEQHVYRYASAAPDTSGTKSPTLEPEAACAKLSRDRASAVLYYADFDAQSLFALLETEEPQLYASLSELASETQDGLLCYETNCGTALAIQEWLLAQLPHEEDMDAALMDAETRMMSEMEVLDPGSGSLYRIITWAPKDHPIRWPESWPADWADRLRTGESWALYFPDESFVPNADKTAYLVFPNS